MHTLDRGHWWQLQQPCPQEIAAMEVVPLGSLKASKFLPTETRGGEGRDGRHSHTIRKSPCEHGRPSLGNPSTLQGHTRSGGRTVR